LFVSRDGGETWDDAAFLSIESGSVFYGVPRFTDPENGIIAATLSAGAQPRLEIYRTQDGGLTWQLASVIPLDPEDQPGAMVPAAVLNNQSVFFIDSEADQMKVADLSDSTFVQGSLQNLPGDVVELSFSAAQTGWAKVVQSQCSGSKQPGDSGDFSCQVQESLFQTYDGGQTWTKIR
jgi:hypothetical protein